MPKTFSERERAVIKEAMLNVGAALLRKKGIRQLSVEDITKGANIAKGSFYSFYNTREEFFWDIIKAEERKLIEEILSVASQDSDLKTKARKIFLDLYLNENCIIYFLPPEDIEYVMRKLPPERLEESRENGFNVNRKILLVCGINDSQENVEIVTAMLQLFRAARYSNIPTTETARAKVFSIMAEGFADYFSEEQTTSED
jgi:AcrR family transcriptional regulator